jgi:hypothetical protein
MYFGASKQRDRPTGSHDRPREARLLAEAAHLYPGLAVGVWVQAATMADIVWARRLQRGDAVLASRVLDPAHFEFRQGEGESVSPSPLRRRATDRLRLGSD